MRAPCPCPFRSWLSQSFAQIQKERWRRKRTAWCQTHSQVSLLTFKTKHRGQKEGPEKEGPCYISHSRTRTGRTCDQEAVLLVYREGRKAHCPPPSVSLASSPSCPRLLQQHVRQNRWQGGGTCPSPPLHPPTSSFGS